MDPTSSAHLDSRRAAMRRDDAAVDGGHSREIELKRARGEISCAECRRLKIKCDKKLPCSSCLRRGCAALCPNGSLSTGQGTRFVMAATDHLHRRVAKMSERIRQLEDALSIAHARTSGELHPLLRKELLNVKAHKADVPPDPDGREDSNPDMIDAFGTLSITEKGYSRFFGAAGGTESLLYNDDDSSYSHNSPGSVTTPESHHSTSKSPPLDPDLIRFSSAFPFTPMGPPEVVQDLIVDSHLPPWDRAVFLAETFFENAGWIFRTVSPAQIMEEIMPYFYRRHPTIPPQQPCPSSSSLITSQPPSHLGPHDLSILLMIFALGALVDLSQPPYNEESEHYYILAKAAVTLQSVLDKPEMSTIQALHLMSIFNAMSQSHNIGESELGGGNGGGADTSMEMSWSLIRLCVQLAEVIGLHRESARWGLPPKVVNRRRALFWDLFLAESWQSLSTGRPPSITTPYIDCQFPVDDEAQLTEAGETEPSFGSWGFRFACDCIAEVVARTFTAHIPPYSTILDLDRRIREFPTPEFPKMGPMPTDEDGMPDKKRPGMAMAKIALSHSKEVILLNLHRSFFAQAMIDDPVNPLRSQYAASFLATYRSATHILKTVKDQLEILPELVARFWSTWTFTFSAAVVCGTVVTRGPSSEFAESALKELDQACDMFTKAAKHSRRAAKALSILQRLQNKAHHARNTYLSTKSSPEPDDKEDELLIFSGHTRLLSPKGSSQSPPSMQGVITPIAGAASGVDSEMSNPPVNMDTSSMPNTISGSFSNMQPKLNNHSPRTPTLNTPMMGPGGAFLMDSRNAHAHWASSSNPTGEDAVMNGYDGGQNESPASYSYDDRVFLHHITQAQSQSQNHAMPPPPPPSHSQSRRHSQTQPMSMSISPGQGQGSPSTTPISGPCPSMHTSGWTPSPSASGPSSFIGGPPQGMGPQGGHLPVSGLQRQPSVGDVFVGVGIPGAQCQVQVQDGYMHEQHRHALHQHQGRGAAHPYAIYADGTGRAPSHSHSHSQSPSQYLPPLQHQHQHHSHHHHNHAHHHAQPQQQQHSPMQAAPTPHGAFPGMREYAEIGLLSEDSGMNQRWTSFVQDSGVFYGSGAGQGP